GLGDKDGAVKALRTAIDNRDPFLFHLPILPAFDALQSEPSFQELLRRINYPQPQDLTGVPSRSVDEMTRLVETGKLTCQVSTNSTSS
ncbi:MAG: hypothetical protein WAV20_20680, partial [Blastocatellia bacterium]